MAYYMGDYYRGDYYRGDPGLLSGIGKFVGGVLGKVAPIASLIPGVGTALGGLAGAAAGILSSAGKQAGVSGILKTVSTPFNPGMALVPSSMGGGNPLISAPVISNYAPPGAGGGALVPSGAGGMMPRGYHLNKSTYARGGRPHSATGLELVPAHSQMVRNRRMNPFNPRALRKAAKRAHAFLRMSSKLVKYYQPHARKGKRYIAAGRRRK